jgi:hypothetical protein
MRIKTKLALANAKEVLQRSPITSTHQEKKLIGGRADKKYLVN